MRLSKVRVTDHRPKAAGMTGLDYLTASQAREAAEHDRNIRDYTPGMVHAAWEDLQGRKAFDKKDPEQRWVMARRAALGRLGSAMRKGGRA